jgi:conjugative transfer region lipoprotein (TIGR03751 family)
MLSACANVVPEKGPTMEQTYDSVHRNKTKHLTNEYMSAKQRSLAKNTQDESQFHLLPNPELRMYVFPHLAENEEVPIPGYFTHFHAYKKDHYALPNEIERE